MLVLLIAFIVCRLSNRYLIYLCLSGEKRLLFGNFLHMLVKRLVNALHHRLMKVFTLALLQTVPEMPQAR